MTHLRSSVGPARTRAFYFLVAALGGRCRLVRRVLCPHPKPFTSSPPRSTHRAARWMQSATEADSAIGRCSTTWPSWLPAHPRRRVSSLAGARCSRSKNPSRPTSTCCSTSLGSASTSRRDSSSRTPPCGSPDSPLTRRSSRAHPRRKGAPFTTCGRSKASAAVAVHPWWALDTAVLVCPDSYQPDHLKDAHGWYCGGRNLGEAPPSPKPFCGCGPNLVNCMRDAAQSGAVVKSITFEVVKTLAYVVRENLPIDQAFTMNSTVRDGLADALYERWRVDTGEQSHFVPILPLNAPAQLAPRYESIPGEHAGILTTQLALSADGGREQQRDMFGLLWCQRPTASMSQRSRSSRSG